MGRKSLIDSEKTSKINSLKYKIMRQGRIDIIDDNIIITYFKNGEKKGFQMNLEKFFAKCLDHSYEENLYDGIMSLINDAKRRGDNQLKLKIKDIKPSVS